MKTAYWLLAVLVLLNGCLGQIRQPKERFGLTPPPPPPNYAKPEAWAGLPQLKDAPDAIPKGADLKDGQADAPADVFFVHPTIHNDGKTWNANPRDDKYNRTVDRTTIKYQASVFNGTCRVFAPRYRQASIAAYFDSTAYGAFDTAYTDVVAAFDYFIKNYNNNRPFFLASHSQGSGHLLRLLREKVYGTPLFDRMIAAYLIGYPVKVGWPTEPIPFCCDPEQTGCWLNYNTFEYESATSHDRLKSFSKPICINPITFTCDSACAPLSQNKGSLNLFFKINKKPIFDAQVKNGVAVTRRKKKFGYFSQKGDFHIMDYSLYYMNLRENIALRTAAFLKKRKG